MGAYRKINLQHFLADLLLIIVTPYLSLLLRVNTGELSIFLTNLNKLIVAIVILRGLSFYYFQTYNIMWRYVSVSDAVLLGKSIAASTVGIIAASYIFEVGRLPRSLYFIDAFIALGFLAGARLARRLLHEYQSKKSLEGTGKRTLIYGAGVTGQGLRRRLSLAKDLNLFVVGFIDDDTQKQRKMITGLKVFGGRTELPFIIRDFEIQQIVIAMPDMPSETLRETLKICAENKVKLEVLNSNLGENKPAFRQIELKDLLRRAPQKIDVSSTTKMIQGKRVLITGAGGSIGSEITRQVLSFQPSKLVILDHSEFNLYSIDQELKSSDLYSEVVVPALVDIKDREALLSVMKTHSPEIVFHAAAYKHVHLVEMNPHTSILNNIEGTKNLLELSDEFKVENFVQISTDKAVNPAGIMGSTKRICEIMTSLHGLKTQKHYCSVRFGNVLGSSGSLIPLLKKQIEEGRPLTITHKDITRYFMLIEEAVALVLKAASIAAPGDINVLRMGDPVKIIDIAKSLITLMGKTESEVEIQYTGLRPGEKMFEELYISGKELNTEHPDILVLPKGDALPGGLSVKAGVKSELEQQIEKMISTAKAADNESVYLLRSIVNSNYQTK